MKTSNLASMKDVLNHYYIQKRAIGQFNINNLEWAIAILNAAKNTDSGVILGVSMSAARYMGGYKTVSNMINALIEDLNIEVPIILHLDHGNSFEECKKAIDAGFSSVMIDGSSYSLEENIAITKKVLDYANKFEVSVEAEVGSIGGEEDGIKGNKLNYASVEDCKIFIENCKVDALAIGYGSVHGKYQEEPKLDFELLKNINRTLNLPLVLHGASGLYDEQITSSINNGVCKININTECQVAWAKKVREKLKTDREVYDPRKIIGSGLEEITNIVEQKIKLFNNK